MRREVASWRQDGWEPPSAFGRAVIDAYFAARAGTPPSLVERVLEPLAARYGADVVTRAFRIVHEEMEAWRAEAIKDR